MGFRVSGSGTGTQVSGFGLQYRDSGFGCRFSGVRLRFDGRGAGLRQGAAWVARGGPSLRRHQRWGLGASKGRQSRKPDVLNTIIYTIRVYV